MNTILQEQPLPRAHIQIVGWNHKQYLTDCIRSCLQQSIRLPVLYIDNGSHDGSADYVEHLFPDVTVVRNAENRGYSGGHNDGLQNMPDSEVAILINPDTILDTHFAYECCKAFAEDSKHRVGAVVPLLLRPKAHGVQQMVDAYGIRLSRSLRGVNHCEEMVKNEFFNALERNTAALWGFTGAAVALRLEATGDIALDGEVFDEDLFSYREDVDVSWRMRNRGWRIHGVPSAQAVHVRAIQKGKHKPARIRQLSWRNYYLVIMKNASIGTVAKNLPFIIAEDTFRCLQLVFTPSLWPAASELISLLPRFAKKRSVSLGS